MFRCVLHVVCFDLPGVSSAPIRLGAANGKMSGMTAHFPAVSIAICTANRKKRRETIITLFLFLFLFLSLSLSLSLAASLTLFL